MRIGLFIDEYLPRTDGVITATANLHDGLRRLGHEVLVVVPDYPGYHDQDSSIIRVPSFDPLIYDNVRFMRYSPKTIRQLVGMQFDIVHAQTNFWASAGAVKVSRRLNIPRVASIHTKFAELPAHYPVASRLALVGARPVLAYNFGLQSLRGYDVPPAYRHSPWLVRKIWRYFGFYADQFDTVVVPSSHFASELESAGVARPIEVVPSSIRLSRFNGSASEWRPGQPLRLVYVGRLSGEKRQDAVINAMAGLKNLPVHLTIIGDGPLMHSYQRLTDSLGLNDRVSFTGNLEAQDVAALIKQSHVGLMVSRGFDTQGLALVEYIAAGLPVVYADKALQETVGPEAGLRVSGSPASIAQAVRRLHGDHKLYSTLSYAGKSQAKNFSHLKLARQMEKIYESLV